jgi:hypothetical protein
MARDGTKIARAGGSRYVVCVQMKPTRINTMEESGEPRAALLTSSLPGICHQTLQQVLSNSLNGVSCTLCHCVVDRKSHVGSCSTSPKMPNRRPQTSWLVACVVSCNATLGTGHHQLGRVQPGFHRIFQSSRPGFFLAKFFHLCFCLCLRVQTADTRHAASPLLSVCDISV